MSILFPSLSLDNVQLMYNYAMDLNTKNTPKRTKKKDLILQGCIFKSIDGSKSQLSYSKIQTES